MIKQALVNHNAFSERETSPIINDLKLTHGEEQKLFCLVYLYTFFYICVKCYALHEVYGHLQ